MFHHEHFNLWLYDNSELDQLVKAKVIERVTLHEWPLACVQRLDLADGRKLIYKSQVGPALEAEFYEKAESDLLIHVDTVHYSDGFIGLLLEFIDAPLLKDKKPSEEEAVVIADKLLQKIAEIKGDLPFYLDISSEQKWKAFVENLVSELRELILHHTFKKMKKSILRELEPLLLSEDVLSVFHEPCVYVHGDLNGQNLLVLPDGYRLIDWERPLLGPKNLDKATLLKSLGFDPAAHVGAGVVTIMNILKIHWAVRCAAEWFPEGASVYDQQVFDLASELIQQ